MEEWIKVIAPLIGIAGLWWKLTTSMATKAELNAMRSDMSDMKSDLRAEIAEVKADLKQDIAEVKSDMAALKTELKSEIAEVKSDITDLKADLKAENTELRADIREIRQLLYKNVVDTGSKGDNKDVDRRSPAD